jgi:hypothetical protein
MVPTMLGYDSKTYAIAVTPRENRLWGLLH